MIATVVSLAGAVTRVLVSDEPMPAADRQRLERAGYAVAEAPSVRVRAVSDFREAVDPLLQSSLF